jgi:hypothetical protein
MPQLHRTTSHSRVSLHGGSTVGHDYTAGSTAGHDYTTGHEGGIYYPSHGYPEPSLRARISASVRYLDRYAPLERYVSYGVD